MPQSFDAIIIGAGIIGNAIAFELSKKGYKTLSVDSKGDSGHGSTSGSCAIIRVHYSTFEGTAFAYEGYFYWKNWNDYLQFVDERGLATFKETGCLIMQTQANNYLEKHIKICDELQIPYQQWNREKIEKKLPHYNLEQFYPPKLQEEKNFGLSNGNHLRSGIFFPTAGYVTDPALSAHNIQRAAENTGATFLFNSTVTEIIQSNNRVEGICLANGDKYTAPIVVNVAGPWSCKINQIANVTKDMMITTRPLKQEVVHINAPKSIDFENNGFVVSDSDVGVYCRPEKGNNILIGSEDPPCDAHQWVEDASDYDQNFTEQWRTLVLRYAQRVPELEISTKTRGVVDLYDTTEDWIPIYDCSSLKGYYMACGSSGNQYKNAPIAGKMMAKLIEYCEDNNNHDRNPCKFLLPYINKTINVGFYSRRRKINKDSSFSVLG